MAFPPLKATRSAPSSMKLTQILSRRQRRRGVDDDRQVVSMGDLDHVLKWNAPGARPIE